MCWRPSNQQEVKRMYETLKRLYDAGKATTAGILRAVTIGWITQAEYAEIVGEEAK